MDTLTKDKAVELLKALAEEQPDKVAVCTYTDAEYYIDKDSGEYVAKDPTRPECIVGHVLHRSGVSLESLLRFEGKNASAINAFSDILGIEAEEDAIVVLARAQRRQDEGRAWSESVGSAVEYAKGIVE